ncbi:MAG: TerB family tellurite resistance protein [Vicingaceae bacterium]
MEGERGLYYSLGILAYAVAKADGSIQKEEKDKLGSILQKEFRHKPDFDYAEIIFQLLTKEDAGIARVYDWAFSEIKRNRHSLTEEMKVKMVRVMREVAMSFRPVTEEETAVIEKFVKDIAAVS